MKRLIFRLILPLILLAAAHVCIGDEIRQFGGDKIHLSTPFQAEVAIRADRHEKTYFNTRSTIWYKNPDHYRVDMYDLHDKGITYDIRSGDCCFTAWKSSTHIVETVWQATPTFWISQDLLETDLGQTWKIKNPTLVGVEKVQGLQSQHWQGKLPGKHSVAARVDVWLSMDKRFPLVLKTIRTAPRFRLTWEITRLKLGEPIPEYIFTTQIHPKCGLLTLLKLQYWPLWMVLVWHLLYLAALIWLISSLMASRVGWRRTLNTVLSAISILAVLQFHFKTDNYLNRTTGIPVLFLMAVMLAATLAYCYRKYGIPGGVKFFSGTPWLVVALAVCFGLIGFARGADSELAREMGISEWQTAWLPQTLITVVIYMTMWVALEEIVFRGYLTGVLNKQFSSVRTVNLIQALAFMSIHIHQYIHSGPVRMGASLVWIFALGLLFGWLRLRYRNLWAPFLVHFAFNTGLGYATYAAMYATIHYAFK